MTKPFESVAGEALEETREKLERNSTLYRENQDCRAIVNFALGLFTGAVLRRMRGEPDPDEPRGSQAS